jgi:hypothetical protein
MDSMIDGRRAGRGRSAPAGLPTAEAAVATTMRVPFPGGGSASTAVAPVNRAVPPRWALLAPGVLSSMLPHSPTNQAALSRSSDPAPLRMLRKAAPLQVLPLPPENKRGDKSTNA